MKRILIFLGAITIALFITACDDNDNNANDNQSSDNMTKNENNSNAGNKDTNTDNNNENTNGNNENANNEDTNNEDADSADDMQAKMDDLPYNEIELEVDYGKNKEYEIEIEQDEGQPIEAEVEDELNDVYLTGSEAFNELYPKVEALSIDKDTDKEDAIKDALDTFDLDDDYDEFEIEITFSDGQELEYEDK